MAAAVLALALLGTAASAVSGHSGGTLVVEPPVAKPGDPLLVHGTFLWSDAAVTIDLVAADGSATPLGTGATNGNGALETAVVLPESVRPGTYAVRLSEPAGDTREVELVVDPGLQIPVAWLVGGMVAAVLVLVTVARLRAGNREGTHRRAGKPGSGDASGS